MNTPISLYIHIPFCLSKCYYCDFFSIPVEKCCKSIIPDNYIEALCAEIEFRIKNYKNNICKSIYIGGGTPSLLNSNQISRICNTLFGLIKKTDDFEFSFEVNPDDVSKNLLNTLEQNGINRISCGIQSLNESSLKNVKRRAGVKENISALECFSKFWQYELSLDLICGLPMENHETFIDGVKKIIEYNPDHISMYSLTIEEETPLGKMVEQGQIDYDYVKADEVWLESKEILEKNGYLQYEVSNFCKNGKECKHNLTYWKHEGYLGFGSGGTGTVYNSDGTGTRWTNSTDIQEYIRFWTNKNLDSNIKSFNDLPQNTEVVELEDSIFEYFMMGLRKLSGISDEDFFAKFNFEMPVKYKMIFEKWKKNGLAEIIPSNKGFCYRLNNKGLLLLNRFLEEL